MKLLSDSFIESQFISEGQININGTNIPYKVISEDNVITDEEGKSLGSIFSFSYFRSDIKDNTNRPVIFAFNGGPGSSSIWLHLGFLGPKRVKYDDVLNPPICTPVQIEENTHCMLDLCDIVLIDPVETGYGILIDEEPETKKQFFGIEQDAYSIALFIEKWLIKYNRWDSPKFLISESYGTVRSSVLSNMLMGGTKIGRLIGIPLNGIIMLGSALTIYEGQQYVERSVIELPTMAATSWYHNHASKPDISTFIEESYKFSYEEYLKALFLGNSLPQDKLAEIINKLSYFTGLPMDYFVENGIRINVREFATQIMKNIGFEVGIYDGRYLLKRINSLGQPDPVADDPAMGTYTPSFIQAMNNIIKKDLNITFDRTYKAINFSINKVWEWENECNCTPIQHLKASMRRNPHMKIFFGSGYYDLCTVMGDVRYIASQICMPMERVIVKEYPSGHMPYLGEDSAKILEFDIRKFINESI